MTIDFDAVRAGLEQAIPFNKYLGLEVVGVSDGSETENDLAFIAKARDALADGLTVFYSSWW